MLAPGINYTVTIRHWFPILTYCPVNGFPDFVYVSVVFKNELVELYEARRTIRKILSGQKMFMEDLATLVICYFPNAVAVNVRLAFNRHHVQVTR